MNRVFSRSKGLLVALGVGAIMAAVVACGSNANANPKTELVSNPQSSPSLVTQEALMASLARADASGVSGYHGQGNSGIWVNGSGKVKVAPDLGIVNMGVEGRANTVAEARNEAAAAMEKMIEALKANGVADRDIQTQYFNISPQYSSRKTPCPAVDMPAPADGSTRPAPECYEQYESVIIGYQVNNHLTVKVRNLDNLGTIIDAVTAAGGDATRLDGISFTVDNPKALENQARAAAVEDLMDKAEQFASLTNSRLGRLVHISEVSYASPLNVSGRAYDMAVAEGAPTPIMTGEQEIVITVQAAFEIGQPAAE